MKHTSVIISTYTADVSGVCSALYELGGMVVIHDPSGCNSTYNTHDEPRWYDMDSLVFISGLSEIDAIMGSDDKLIRDISRAAKKLHPAFIALVQTPVPMMTGIDFYAIRDILKEETGLPVYYFPTNGMHSYIQGVNMALAAVARYMVEEKAELPAKSRRLEPADSNQIDNIGFDGIHKPAVNLLGVTPLDFSVNESLSSVKRILADGGFNVLSCLAMGSRPEEIAGAGEAHVNLVISSAGIEAARVLEDRFGTPYVVGLPTGLFAGRVIEALRDSFRSGQSCIAYMNDGEIDKSCADPSAPEVCLIGEAVITQSIREAVRMEYGVDVHVLCYLETPEGLLDASCSYLSSEEELRDALKGADAVIADPMYQPICPEAACFIDFPHEAFSGRIYRKQMPDLTKPDQICRRIDLREIK